MSERVRRNGTLQHWEAETETTDKNGDGGCRNAQKTLIKSDLLVRRSRSSLISLHCNRGRTTPYIYDSLRIPTIVCRATALPAASAEQEREQKAAHLHDESEARSFKLNNPQKNKRFTESNPFSPHMAEEIISNIILSQSRTLAMLLLARTT